MTDPIRLLRDDLDRPQYGKANGNGPLHLLTGTADQPETLCGRVRFDVWGASWLRDPHTVCRFCQTRLNASERRAKVAREAAERATKRAARAAEKLTKAAQPRPARRQTAMERVAADLDIPAETLRQAILRQAPKGLRVSRP